MKNGVGEEKEKKKDYKEKIARPIHDKKKGRIDVET